MITTQWLQDQVRLSVDAYATTNPLRQLIFHVVHRALVAHYGGDYSIRCLQSCHAIQTLLGDLGIRSGICEGALCFANGYASLPGHLSWTGFWDKDHHYWLSTSFGEIVDLTIRQSHRHPSRRRRDGFEAPAFWWNIREGFPKTIHYLPAGVLADDARFEDEKDSEDLNRFMLVVRKIWKERLSALKPRQISFPTVLTGRESWDALRDTNPWVRFNCFVAEREEPCPLWVANRHEALCAQWAAEGNQDLE